MNNENEFEWPALYKAEERIDREVYETAFDYVKDFYSVDDIDDLTEIQMHSIMNFVEKSVNEYSPFTAAFDTLYHEWEANQ